MVGRLNSAWLWIGRIDSTRSIFGPFDSAAMVGPILLNMATIIDKNNFERVMVGRISSGSIINGFGRISSACQMLGRLDLASG